MATPQPDPIASAAADYRASLASGGAPPPGLPSSRSFAPANGSSAAPSGEPPPSPPSQSGPATRPAVNRPGLWASATRLFSSVAQAGLQEASRVANDPVGAAAGLGTGVALRSPGQLLGGIIDASNDVGTFVGDFANGQLQRGARAVGLPGVATALQQGLEESHKAIPTVRNGGASWADILSFRQSLGKVGLPEVNQFGAEGGAMALTAAAAPEGIVGRALGAGAGGFVGQNPGKDNPVIDRTLNAMGAAGLEVGGHLALSAIGTQVARLKNAGKLATTVTQATPADALKDGLDQGFGIQRTQEAKAAASVATPDQAAGAAAPQEAAAAAPDDRRAAAADVEAPGDRLGASGRDLRNDLPPPPEGTPPGSQPVEVDIVKDANAALSKAGASERLPEDGTHQITPDGRAIVAPVTKEIMDGTPLGRAFASRDDLPDNSDPGQPHVLLKEDDGQGGQRIVFRSAPEDLQGLLAAANHYRANPDAIDIRPGDDAYPRVGQWKLSSLGDPDSVTPIARAMADRMEGPRAALSDDDYRRLASQTGQDPGIVAAVAHDMAAGKEPTFTQGALIRTLAAKTSEDVASLRGTDWTTLDPAHPMVQDALEKYHNAYTWANYLQRFKYYAGLALRSLSVRLDAPAIARPAVDATTGKLAELLGVKPVDGFAPGQDIPDLETLKANFGRVPEDQLSPMPPGMAPPFPRNGQELNDALEQHAFAEKYGPQALAGFWQSRLYRPSALMYLRHSVASLFTANLVSAASTYARDTIGPAIYGGLRTLERTAGGLDAGFASLAQAAGARLSGDTLGTANAMAAARDAFSIARQAPMAYAHATTSVLDSLKAAATMLRDGDGMSAHGHNPVDYNSTGIPQALIDAANGEGDTLQGDLYELGNAINLWPQGVHRLHGGVAELSLRQAYAGEVRAGAMLEAAQQGLTGDDFWNHVKTRVMGAGDALLDTGDMPDPMYKRAYDSAMQTGFVKRVGAEGSIARNVANFVTTLRQVVPESRFILPIFTVPANSMGAVLDHIPGVNTLFGSTRDALLGLRGPIAKAEAYGAMTTGGLILALTAMGARQGLITGAGPQNPAERAVWKANGMTPYSIRVGDTWYGFNRMDVLGQVMGIAANVYDHTVYRSREDPNVAFTGAAAIAETLKDQAALKGLSDFLDFLGNPLRNQAVLRKMENDDTADLLVPRALTQLVADNMDPHQRVVRTPMEAILNALPGGGQELDPMRNFLGEDVYKVPQMGPLGVLPITSSNVNTAAKDDVSAELHRLALASSYAPGVPAPALRSTKLDMRDLPLEDGHSMYDHLVRLRGTWRNDDGDTLRDALRGLFASDDYQTAKDGSTGSLADASDEGSRTAMVQKVFRDFTKGARVQLANDSPAAAHWLAASEVKSGGSAVLAGRPAEHLVTPQGQSEMRALGIDFDAALDKVRGQ